MDEGGHPAIGIGSPGPFLAREQQAELLGIWHGGIGGGGVGEHPDTIPSEHGQLALSERGGQGIQTVRTGFHPDPIPIRHPVERLLGRCPVAEQPWSHRQSISVADE